jgi:XrtJ-associated TM-motif-TM protein
MSHLGAPEKIYFSVDRPTLPFEYHSITETTHMKRPTVNFLGFALLLCVALPLHAQGGCTNSPENPTAILAVIGSAGALFASARARIRARRVSK